MAARVRSDSHLAHDGREERRLSGADVTGDADELARLDFLPEIKMLGQLLQEIEWTRTFTELGQSLALLKSESKKNV